MGSGFFTQPIYFPNTVEDLWNKIFEMCLLDQDYKIVWDNKIKKFKERAKKLNDYNFKTLR